jgi:hypothetical protein
VPHRVAARLLETYDTGAEAQQLARREGAWEVPRQVDDENPPERRLHPPRT